MAYTPVAERSAAPADPAAPEQSSGYVPVAERSVTPLLSPTAQKPDFSKIQMSQSMGNKSIADFPAPKQPLDYSKIEGVAPVRVVSEGKTKAPDFSALKMASNSPLNLAIRPIIQPLSQAPYSTKPSTSGIKTSTPQSATPGLGGGIWQEITDTLNNISGTPARVLSGGRVPQGFAEQASEAVTGGVPDKFKKFASPVGAVAGMIGDPLNLVGGAEVQAIKSIRGIKSEGEALSFLIKLGVPEDLAKFRAFDVVKADTDKAAEALINAIQKDMRTTKPVTAGNYVPVAERSAAAPTKYVPVAERGAAAAETAQKPIVSIGSYVPVGKRPYMKPGEKRIIDNLPPVAQQPAGDTLRGTKDVEDAGKVFYEKRIQESQKAGRTINIDADELKASMKIRDTADHASFAKEAQKAYQQALKVKTKSPTVYITVGGPATGKTEVLARHFASEGGIMLQGTGGNYTRLIAHYKEAEAAGKTPAIVSRLKDPKDAWDYTKVREAKGGHLTSADYFVKRTNEALVNLKKAVEEGYRVGILDDRRGVSEKVIYNKDEQLAILKELKYDLKHEDLVSGGTRENIQLTADVERRAGGESGIREGAQRLPPVSKGRKVTDIPQLERMLQRTRESLAAARANPEAHAKAYGGNRIPQYKEKIQELEGRIATAKKSQPIGGIHTAEEMRSLDRAGQRAQMKEAGMLDEIPISSKAKSVLDRTQLEGAKEGVAQEKLAREFQKEAISDMPAKRLQKFVSPRTGRLPEVTGKTTMRSVSGSGKIVKTSKFGRTGDDIVSELGFRDADHAQQELERYQEARARLKSTEEAVSSRVSKYRDRKAVYDEVVRYVKEQGRSRREQIGSIQDFFKLENSDMKKLLKNERDMSLMNEGEYSDFLKRIEGKATELHFKGIEMQNLRSTIFEKELKNVTNLQRAMSMPKRIEKMTVAQMQKLNELLGTFEKGDKFLGPRQLETVKNTDLKGIRTIREARQRLIEQVNKDRAGRGLEPVKIEDLDAIHVGEMDRYRYDSWLARQNPLYDVMVQEKNKAFLTADARGIAMRDKVDALMKAARSSRKRGFIDQLIPTDKQIFQWLEAPDADKIKIAENMTAAELKAAMHIREWYSKARDYLVQNQMLKRYRQDYITHTRRGFLEAWKEEGSKVAGNVSGEKPGAVRRFGSGLLAAFKETLEKYKQDEAYFNIIDQKTDQVLPLEKFFQFSMQRSGELVPTQNVAKAFMSYASTFEKKRALDALVPKLDIYAHSLTPQRLTPRGLEFDDSLKRFVREWVNTKKGRATDRMLVKPGGKMDWALRTGVALTRFIDLGLSIPVGIASNFGAQAAAYRGLGELGYARGVARLATKQGREILEKYRNFTGESIRAKMKSADAQVGDNLMSGVYSLFSIADRKSRQVFLLGSMTKDEFKAGGVGIDRLARLQTEMGRHLPMEHFESVFGKTALGKVAGQYRTWAVPLVTSTVDDLNKLQKAVRTGDVKFLRSPEAGELLRTSIVSSIALASTWGIIMGNTPSKDQTFMEKVANKSAQDALSLVGAVDPRFWTKPARLAQFLADLADSIIGLKVGKLEGLVTPGMVKQVLPPTKKKTNSGFPALPPLPKLPQLPQLPKLPKMPKVSI